jgi:hypothetical protein
VLLRALAKNKTDRFASVNDFAQALERALVGMVPVAPALVSVTAVMPSVAGPNTTTFSQTAGEMDDDDLDVPPRRPKWHWGVAAAAVLLVGGILLFRPRAVSRPQVANPPPASPAPATAQPTPPIPASVAPPPPPPHEEPPAAKLTEPVPPAAKPSEPIAPSPKAKRPPVQASLPDPFERKAPSRASRVQPGKVAHPSGPLNDDL